MIDGSLTEELFQELWIAREMLSSHYHRDGSNEPTWAQYCKDIGSAKSTVNRWLQRWGETKRQEIERKALPDPDGKFDVLYADPPGNIVFKGGLDPSE